MTPFRKSSSCTAILRPWLLGLWVLAGAGCGADGLSPSADSESPLAGTPAAPSDSASADTLQRTPAPTDPAPPQAPTDSLGIAPPAPTTSAPGIPFGFFSGDYYQLGPTWTATLRGASVGAIAKYLQIAREQGARVFIQFAGGRGKYLDAEGNFDISKWKGRVAPYKAVDLLSYIADGTLAAHYLIDEPEDKTRWNGKPVSYVDLEEMARYSKEVFAGLATIVRVVPTWLQGAQFRWVHLDAAWGQYTAGKGDVHAFRDTQVAAAKNQGLGLMFSLNVLDGGDGSSGREGTISGRHNMSASELTTYGKVLIDSPYACGLLLWRENPAYLQREGVLSALQALSAQAKARSTTSCNQS